jgi:hypothetical protein
VASKKYIGKACAYCGGKGISRTGDHVLAREFFLVSDRDNLPIVPACRRCNTEKSALENYALTVLPIGSRHCDVKAYSEKNIGRRLNKNAKLREQLTLEHSGLWEEQQSGLVLPVMSVSIDPDKIGALFGMIVKGLFYFHWKDSLNEKWMPDVTIIRPHAEHLSFSAILNKMGSNIETVDGDLGRGTFLYWGARGTPKWFSLWQFTLFGGLQFANSESSNQGFTKLSAVTRPDMTRQPFTAEEAGALHIT